MRESLDSDTNVLSAVFSIKLNFDGYPEAFLLLFILFCIPIYFGFVNGSVSSRRPSWSRTSSIMQANLTLLTLPPDP